MFASLSGLLGRGNVLPFIPQETPHATAFGGWQHFSGKMRDDGALVSIFRINSSNKSDPKLVAARNGVKRLKMLRHPNVLAFKDTAEVEEKGETVIYLVTEPVKPLADVLDDLQMTGSARAEFVAMGLYHISRAVSFLNNDCKLIHGNVCLRAVAVTATLDWRLHGFDLLSEHAGGGDLPLMAASWMVAPQYKAAEVAKAEWHVVQQGPPWAVDAWGLGCLMQEAFSGQQLTRTEDLRSTSHIPPPILQDYQRLLSSQPSRRLNPSALADSGVLRNKLVDTIAFLENLAVKDAIEKDVFFKRLPQALPALPLPVAQRKLLPMIAGALEFGGAPALALSSLLQIGNTMDADDFTKDVVPAISKLFASTDRSIRRSLLESIDTYGKSLTESVVENQIFPHVANGFGDSNAYLRELTLKSMLVLAPKLGQKTINQTLLKHLAKLQVDEEPPIRANTTILLGNLAGHLSEAAAKRVLLNAFTRALKDTFPPARVAGLKAMVATAELHSPEEAGIRILPALGPLTVDAVAEVRQSALAALEAFSAVLRQHSTALDSVHQAAGGAAQDLAQGATAGSWSVGLGNNLSWSPLSSLTSLAGKAATPGAGKGDLMGRVGSSADLQPTPGFAPPAPPSEAASTNPFTSEHGGSHSGWDDLDAGSLDLDDPSPLEDAEELAARQRLTHKAARSRPAASSRADADAAPPSPPPATSHAPTSSNGGDGWGDGAADETWAAFESSVTGGNNPAALKRIGNGRPAGSRPPRREGTAGVRRTAGSKAGSMKLGAQKLSKPPASFDM